MSIGTILSLASGFLKLANLIFSYIERNALEKIGEDREKLRQFETLNAVSVAVKAVDEKYAKMTDAEIKTDIQQQGDFRD